VIKVNQDADNGFHTMAAGTYELVVNITVLAPGLPQTGGSMFGGALPLWFAAGGLLILTVGLVLQRRVRRAR
jgi:hypothetical protein